MSSHDIPVAFFAPTMFGPPQIENLHKIQKASIAGRGPLHLIGERWQEEGHRHIFDKHVEGWKKAIEEPGVREEGYVVMLHHDTVIEDMDLFNELLKCMQLRRYWAAGPRDGGTIARRNANGSMFCNSHFIVCDPRYLDKWWEGEDWDGILSYEDYWVLSRKALGNILYLGTEWREPRIGRSTSVIFRKKPVASHLWFSMGDLRVSRGSQTVEGHEAEDTAKWRSGFLDEYAERFNVELTSCSDTVWSLDSARKGDWSEVFSANPRGGVQKAAEAAPPGE